MQQEKNLPPCEPESGQAIAGELGTGQWQFTSIRIALREQAEQIARQAARIAELEELLSKVPGSWIAALTGESTVQSLEIPQEQVSGSQGGQFNRGDWVSARLHALANELGIPPKDLGEWLQAPLESLKRAQMDRDMYYFAIQRAMSELQQVMERKRP